MIEQLPFRIVELHQQPFQPEAYVLDVAGPNVTELLKRLEFRRQTAVIIQRQIRMQGTIMSANHAGQMAIILHDKSAQLALGDCTLEVQSLPPYYPPHEDDPGTSDALHTQACLEEHLGAALAILKDRTPTPLEQKIIDLLSIYVI